MTAAFILLEKNGSLTVKIVARNGNDCDNKNIERGVIMSNIEKVCTFLKEAGTYYLATVEGDQPRVRPFGTIHVFEDKLYIQTGKVKEVSKQIAANPKVEICAMRDGEWIRVAGTLVEDDRVEARQSMLDAYPSLQAMYSADDGNTQVFYFKDATATISSFTHEPVVITF